MFFFLYYKFKKPKHYKSIGVTGSQEKWVESLKHVARYAKLENGRLTVKFDEISDFIWSEDTRNSCHSWFSQFCPRCSCDILLWFNRGYRKSTLATANINWKRLKS